MAERHERRELAQILRGEKSLQASWNKDITEYKHGRRQCRPQPKGVIYMKYTVKMFLEDYEGFDFAHGEIVIVDQRCGKQYICKYQNGNLIHQTHDLSRELEREVWSWTHTKHTMLIVI